MADDGGSGRLAPVTEHNSDGPDRGDIDDLEVDRGLGRLGAVESSESEASSEEDDSEDGDESEGPPSSSRSSTVVLRGGGAVPSLAGGVMHSSANQVTVLNFGTVNLEGKNTGIEIGNKTEYLGSVTVQQIVHGEAASSPGTAGSSSFLRGHGPPAQGENVRPQEPRPTGLVLRGTPEGNGYGGGCGKKGGNGLLLKHLLGRKFDTASWLPIALVSCITIITVAIDSIIFAPFHNKNNTELLPPHHHTVPVMEYADSSKTPPRTTRMQETLPKLHRSVIIPRSMWQAKPPKEYTPLEHPVEYVIISHTATEPCDNIKDCSQQVLMVQRFHVESRNWSDIGYNFLVGGDGNAYEGRGWEYVGAHAKGYNIVSIGISFIGTFTDVLPPPAQIRACKLLIKEGVRLGKISSNYKLIGHRQVSPTESPGEKLYAELQNWEHWSPEV